MNKNKVLTISIAAYNVEKFIKKTLDSLIIKNMEILEVLVINDGSKDNTLEIAKEYEKKYPNTFRVINKENGGYGSTINAGIKYATGKYFKQLDGDDWYVTKNLNDLCLKLQTIDTDIVYTPYIKHNINDNSEEIVENDITNYSKITDLEEAIKYAKPVLYMHNLAFKTDIFRNNNIKIDENCFYTDTEYVIFPIIYSKTISILNIPIYVYRYGDENQSVGRLGRLKHYKDHIRMSNSLLSKVSEIQKLSSNLSEYFKEYFASIFASGIANYLMVLNPTKENYNLIKEYDKKIFDSSEDIYTKMNKYSKTVKNIRNSNYILYVIWNTLKNKIINR